MVVLAFAALVLVVSASIHNSDPVLHSLHVLDSLDPRHRKRTWGACNEGSARGQGGQDL